MNKRVNIILPEETLDVMDRAAPRGARSRFVAEAIMHYVRCRGGANLRRRLKEGAMANARRDLAVAEQWFTLDEQAWHRDRSGKRSE